MSNEAIGQRLVMPLLNVHFSRDQIVVTDALEIRRVTQEERDRWMADADASRLTVPEELAQVSHAIEQRGARFDPPLMEMPGPAEDLYSLIGLIDIRMPERLRAPFIEWTCLGLGWAPAIYELPNALKTWQQRLSAFIRVDDEMFGRYWSLITSPTDHSRRLRRALGRATSAREQYFTTDVIFSSTIGLECLFSPSTNGDEPPNNTNVVVGSIVEWLSDPETSTSRDFEQSFLVAKRHYRICSAIVHGKEVDSESLCDAAKTLLEVLRRCIGIAFVLGVEDLGEPRLFDRFCEHVTPAFASQIATRTR